MDEATARAQRKVYIRVRIPEIRDEIKKLIAERRGFPKDVETMEPPARKIVSRRRVYVIERLAELKAELRALQAEIRPR